ncbi:MAG: DNA primase [Oscillospiraceae bacterium]|nr:DNA primase [Oscillospiraceae bacterium]
MPIPDSFLDALTERCDIVEVVSRYVSLTKKGGNLFGLCPFHNEKTPSFSVSPDKQFYHCFGCGKGGGVVSFIMEIENLSFPEAVRFLAERAGMPLPEEGGDEELPRLRKRLLALNKEAARWFHALLWSPAGEKAAAYLERRQIRKKTAVNFGLGFAPDSWDGLLRAMEEKGYSASELLSAGLAAKGKKPGSAYDKFRNRLMFPVLDVRGEVVGFSGRALEEGQEPKYLNSPETVVFSKRRSLFGINLAKNSKRGSILLVEGNIDVVTLHQAGFDNAVAAMGTALTTEQTRLISRYAKEIVLCYDNDPAGKKATERALDILRDSEFTVRVLKLPDRMVDGKAVKIDADDFIKLHGPDAFEQLLKGSGGGMDYRLMELCGRFDLSTDEGRVEYLRAACELIAALPSPVEREVWSRRAAEGAGVSAEAMIRETEQVRKKRSRSAKQQYERSSVRPAAQAQPQARSLRYENIVSARAEEGVIRTVLRSPDLLESCPLEPEEFSSPFLRSLFETLLRRRREGLSLSAAALLSGLSEEESTLLAQILQAEDAPGSGEDALADCVRVVHSEYVKRSGDLRAIAELMKNKRG